MTLSQCYSAPLCTCRLLLRLTLLLMWHVTFKPEVGPGSATVTTAGWHLSQWKLMSRRRSAQNCWRCSSKSYIGMWRTADSALLVTNVLQHVHADLSATLQVVSCLYFALTAAAIGLYLLVLHLQVSSAAWWFRAAMVTGQQNSTPAAAAVSIITSCYSAIWPADSFPSFFWWCCHAETGSSAAGCILCPTTG